MKIDKILIKKNLMKKFWWWLIDFYRHLIILWCDWECECGFIQIIFIVEKIIHPSWKFRKISIWFFFHLQNCVFEWNWQFYIQKLFKKIQTHLSSFTKLHRQTRKYVSLKKIIFPPLTNNNTKCVRKTFDKWKYLLCRKKQKLENFDIFITLTSL